MSTVKTVLQQATEDLQKSSGTPKLDAEILLEYTLKKAREFFFMHPEYVIERTELDQFQQYIERRQNSEPVAYIVGEKEFYGRSFAVNPHVLIPRPETEQLVDMCIEYCSERGLQTPTILEIGTGSGCIAVTLAHELPQAKILATDISQDALTVAKKNASLHSVEIECRQSDVYEKISDKKEGIDIIISNPPYVREQDIDAQRKDMNSLAHEPQNALYAEESGFDILRRIISAAPHWLKPNGALFVEMGESHSLPFSTLSQKKFPEHTVEVKKDYAGLVRYGVVTPKNT